MKKPVFSPPVMKIFSDKNPSFQNVLDFGQNINPKSVLKHEFLFSSYLGAKNNKICS
ncbi:Uncharacterized protein dnm_074300 [Desulfonema magnum]|uniref:Uncharacterized protein n=1 Tax=Desulfonema magnum TaxID=45655 RepID=A0A975GRW4_9BACT|nr:Uncharacterized protein dnm_074300 [Desulfonema magnum]